MAMKSKLGWNRGPAWALSDAKKKARRQYQDEFTTRRKGMQTKRQRPTPKRRVDRKNRFFFNNRRLHGNTAHPEISTLPAKNVFHDIYAVMEGKGVPLVHLRGGAP